MTKKPHLYYCAECEQSFPTRDAYIDHLQYHQEVSEVPKPKSIGWPKRILYFLIGKKIDKSEKKETQGGQVIMADTEQKDKEDIASTDAQADKEKIKELEKSIHELETKHSSIESSLKKMSEMVVDLHDEILPDKGVPVESPEMPQVEQKGSGGRMVRVTVKVPERQSGEFLKSIQGQKEYIMENLEVVGQG